MSQFAVSALRNTATFMHQNNIEGLRFVKHIAFDWTNHLGLLPKSGEKVKSLIGRTTDLADVYDTYQSLREFVSSTDKLKNFFCVNPIEVIIGNSEIHNQALELISDSLGIYAGLVQELFLINSPAAKLIETVSIMASIARNLQKIYSALTLKDPTEKKLELTKEIASLSKNLINLSENLIKESVKQTLMLSCGSVIYAAKITQFAIRNTKN